MTTDQAAIDALAEALRQPGLMLFLDGRNEHGSHVIPSYPTTISIHEIEKELADTHPDLAEDILQKAEEAGFSIGDLVWTIWVWNPPERGNYGRVEVEGYWEFVRIDPDVTVLLASPASALAASISSGRNRGWWQS